MTEKPDEPTPAKPPREATARCGSFAVLGLALVAISCSSGTDRGSDGAGSNGSGANGGSSGFAGTSGSGVGTEAGGIEPGKPLSCDYGYTSGAFGSTDMHDLIHKVNDRNGPLAKDPAARKIVQEQCRLEVTKLARLLDMLSAVKEADGGTLLDHSVVVYCGQIGYGSHDLARLPWMLIGGAGGYFKTGRYVSYGNPSALDAGHRGIPHNNLFVSLANAMGVATNTFGNPSVCTGPLDGLRA